MKKCIITLFLILFPAINSLSPGLWRKENNRIIYSFQDQQINQFLKTAPFTRDHLKLALEINVRHPGIVYNQALLETGRFKSKIFHENNNLFGMKLPRRRSTFAIGKSHGHVVYKHWYDAVLDYKLYQEWYLDNGYNLDNYYVFLEKVHYSSKKSYCSVLEKIN